MKSSLITEIKLILKGGFYSFFSRLRKRFNKKLFDFGEARKNKKILNEVSKLGDLKDYEIGSTNWLKICEIEMGGFVRDVPRNKVSVLDPRSVRQLQTGGMTGGDRMIHHGYSNYYSKYLKRFLEEENNLVILECGILKGSGLAIWSKLFPNSKIIGLDIDLSYTRANLKNLKKRGAFKERDPKLIEFDQFNPDVKELKNILDGQKIDIAIDDGFHSNICIINTFIALKELMASNYTYFIEDNHLVYEELKDIITNENIHSHGRLTVIEK